ncbi:L-seryl-tRNA(Sec) selenium transferase [Citroniella saccharovorans]|uniref:L-seryl-tRNA(Sec) selenium transferase n=1 Tax=Citroniella saccharovorans TaxID=2053367 RepID=A0AAW9MZW8_9FIRM|nr:L-seryl-tRNA(Sec) selenium transferase [Citroniella saccharovorans]MEB3429935.1 L-seryl-tRNA(Sec) selenium transferase [Citroniella saccharovorans]
MGNLFKLIPKVDEVIEKEEIKSLIKLNSRKIVVDSIREVLDDLRQEIKSGIDEDILMNNIRNINSLVEESILNKKKHHLVKLINATGIVIHTNLGRSPLAKEAVDSLTSLASSYSNLEYDLDEGKRGSRYSHLDEIVRKITGAEASMVVNNNAAAVLLILSALCSGKEVITSRGELIEIGGAFRIPDVCKESASSLIEVGTTNKTHLKDYEEAINEDTAAILKVHTSNYKIVGFTEGVDNKTLSSLKKDHDILIIEDLGSGVLVDFSKYGLSYEPTIQNSIQSGVDLVSFSGDKLLGGPQAGVIVGRKDLIDKIKTHPLTRALRVDKFTIAALEATLRLYLDENIATQRIPTLNMIIQKRDFIRKKAEKLASMIDNNNLNVDIIDTLSEVGGGSMPGEKLESSALAINSDVYKDFEIERFLRGYEIPIITRIENEKVIIDLRTVSYDEFEIIAKALNLLGA